ncbi:hypothetical protein EV13_2649 [Prochlorococcus sp. MIT 0702]|nr:hypothetical protein EV12_2596 [Prochlorococcus sp. MIT 0701]KGG25876.1 hypothetical protein EV13_2649 [Prochlorococcus sp. MIT 0702]KGG30950.1 hypothetical protein EV14_2890 [Prochlorococcus sp. MIT 0703]
MQYLVKLVHIGSKRFLAFVAFAALESSMQHLIAIKQEWP